METTTITQYTLERKQNFLWLNCELYRLLKNNTDFVDKGGIDARHEFTLHFTEEGHLEYRCIGCTYSLLIHGRSYARVTEEFEIVHFYHYKL